MCRCLNVIVRAILAALILQSAGALAREPEVADSRLVFRLPDLQGDTITSNDERLAGKVLLVTLWATWCPPCLTEIPTFIDLQQRLRDSDLQIVAIAFESASDPELRRAGLQSLCDSLEVNYLVLDGGPPAEFETALPGVDHVKGRPVEIVIDRSGSVVSAQHGYGYRAIWAQKLERELTELLARHESGDSP
jgi:thiol-disulfide isomerase/thioredoxin